MKKNTFSSPENTFSLHDNRIYNTDIGKNCFFNNFPKQITSIVHIKLWTSSTKSGSLYNGRLPIAFNGSLALPTPFTLQEFPLWIAFDFINFFNETKDLLDSKLLHVLSCKEGKFLKYTTLSFLQWVILKSHEYGVHIYQ